MKTPPRRQTGAALVVGLILLVALTLMAIASMNTASLDLIMAGNEQYRSRAFNAAEAGIERALRGGIFDTSADDPGPGTVSVADDTASYRYTITRPNSGSVEPPPPGNSEGTFGAVYFRIESTGTSARGAQATHVQELFQVVQSPDDISHDDSCGNAGLDSTTSTC